MAYADTAQSANRPGALIATVAIHGAIGAVLVAGLGVVYEPQPPAPNPRATDVPDVTVPVPPPPPDPVEENKTTPPRPDVFVPPAPIPIPNPGPTFEPAPPVEDPVITYVPPAGGTGSGTLPPIDPPSPTPTFDPIAAKPANDRGSWVTVGDYKPSWIRREYVGTVRFEVDVGTNGKVTGCRVTSGSGHGVLDTATCKLVTKRARFDPALNSMREKVKGSYSGAVRWELPD